MELSKFMEEVAEKHVDKSLVEMVDEQKVSRWQSGERAKEQADEIVSAVVAEAIEALEQRSKTDEGK